VTVRVLWLAEDGRPICVDEAAGSSALGHVQSAKLAKAMAERRVTASEAPDGAMVLLVRP
jgi:hypothetical protein